MRNPTVNGICTEIPFFPSVPAVLAAAAQQCPARGLRVTEEASVACGAIGGALTFPPTLQCGH